MVGKNFQPPKILGSTIGSYTELQQRYTQGTYMEQMITERRQRLVEQLKQSGFGRQLQSYQKQVQYYQQQLRQAKALLEQPDQLAMKLLGYASRLQLFRTFMEKHSAFAAIFPQPNPIEALQTPGSLQTRVALQNQMGGSLGMPNPQPQLQQQVDQAQQQLKGLKDKLSSNSWGSADEMPVAKTNEEKTQRKWKRLELGGNLQSSRATNFFPNTSDLGLTVGYKLNSKSILGIGATYKLGWGRDWHNVKLTHEGIGLRSFLDWRLKGSIWMTGGAELNHFQRIENLGLLKDVDNWQQSAVIGIARKFKVGKMNTDARLLYDFFWHMQVPRTQPILFRIGYTFK